ncbi:hypothetical protein BDZ45DRAFT_627939 [Acephala macrosclerotiorum]|nr:hypothetical protein BDZ45DRAFT_627939 [Acephala macrosclerotiorum]
MSSLTSLCVFLAVFLLLGQSTAHFLLNYPPTIGFDDSLEGEAPCGSFTVDFSTDNVTNYYVGGDTLAMTSIHPQATWLFRATLDITASGNWTSLLPAVQQTGLGDYCEPKVAVPASWAGSKGVIGVVQDAPDGILYQCAAVNFIAGTATTVPSVCTNVTGLSAVYTTDAALSSLPATFSSATSTSTSTSTSSSTAKSSANTIHSPSYAAFGPLIWVALVGSATLIAFLL